MLEIVARIVLAQTAQAVPHAPIRQHRLDAENKIAHHAIAQHLHAARIGRNQAPDHRHALRAKRQREQPVILLGNLLRPRENDAGLQRHCIIEHVHLAHLVHALQRDQHFALRHRPVDHARIAALRVHREPVLPTQRDGGRHLLGRRWLHQHRRRSLPASAPVADMRIDLVRIGRHALRPQRVREARDECGNPIALIVSHDRHPECLPVTARFSQVRRPVTTFRLTYCCRAGRNVHCCSSACPHCAVRKTSRPVSSRTSMHCTRWFASRSPSSIIHVWSGRS